MGALLLIFDFYFFEITAHTIFEGVRGGTLLFICGFFILVTKKTNGTVWIRKLGHNFIN